MIRKLWPLLLGFTIWALAFVALYTLQALGCLLHWPEFWHRALLIALAIATIAALAALLISQRRTASTASPPIQTTSQALTLAAIAASIVTFAPVLFVSACV